MKTKIIYPLIAICLALFLPVLVHAQAPLPGDTVDVDVPIDGGLSILLAAGVGYGVKKFNDKKKKKNTDSLDK